VVTIGAVACGGAASGSREMLSRLVSRLSGLGAGEPVVVLPDKAAVVAEPTARSAEPCSKLFELVLRLMADPSPGASVAVGGEPELEVAVLPAPCIAERPSAELVPATDDEPTDDTEA